MRGKKLATIIFLVGLITIWGVCYSQEQEEATTVIQKEVRGIVSAVSSHFITIVYKQDTQRHIEYEIDLPIDKDVKLRHKKRLSEILLFMSLDSLQYI